MAAHAEPGGIRAFLGRIEKKVKAATLGAFVSSAVIATLNAWMADDSLLGSMPGWAQTLIVALGPTAVTFLSGWAARHTPKPSE